MSELSRNIRKIIYFERIPDFISAFMRWLRAREHPMLLKISPYFMC